MFVKFDNIKIDVFEHGVAFSEIEYGSGQLDYLELLISGHIDYVYFHFGDSIGTKIVIFKEDYKNWIKDAIKNGANV